MIQQIPRHWRQIAALQVEDEGLIAVVWLARDPDTDVTHLNDCCLFRREVLAVIAEGLNNRGRWVPVAWEKKAKAVADKLLERGCNMLPDPHDDTEAVAEVTTREIWERMRTGRFKVDRNMAEWLDEYRGFSRRDNRIPQGYPLMAATRTAMAQIGFAKRLAPRGRRPANYPTIAIV